MECLLKNTKKGKKTKMINKHYKKKLPDELEKYYSYEVDCGHSIWAIPQCLLNEAEDCMDEYMLPVPVKYILEKGYKIHKNHIICDVIYDEIVGLKIKSEYFEMQYTYNYD